MLGRRRPLARAAVVGGAAYHVGKRRAEGQMAEEAYRSDQQAQLDQIQYQQQQMLQQQGQQPHAAGGLSDDSLAELEKLAKLKEQGILTQAEFDAQKARILASA
jgi:membrane protease subunit (stomatin/prohibitin family)